MPSPRRSAGKISMATVFPEVLTIPKESPCKKRTRAIKAIVPAKI